MSKNIKYITEYKVFSSDDYEEARQHIGEEGCFADFLDNLEAPVTYNIGVLGNIVLCPSTTLYHQQDGEDYLYFLLPVKTDLVSQNS